MKALLMKMRGLPAVDISETQIEIDSRSATDTNASSQLPSSAVSR